jgi:hypothetical protein
MHETAGMALNLLSFSGIRNRPDIVRDRAGSIYLHNEFSAFDTD